MPDKKRSKRPASAGAAQPASSPPAGAVEEKPANYRAMVGLSNDRTGRNYAPGDLLTTEDFDPQVLAHWAETGRVVAL